MKIAIVTGASSGLGRAFVRQLDREGGLDEIWGVARRAGRMEELAGELSTPMRVLALDLIREESALELRDLLEREQPDVRVLINAAGFGKFGTYADMTVRETGDMIDLNCKAAVNLTAAVLPLNVYAATKAFLLQYSRALRWEVARRGIWVTAVCPSWIKTEFIAVAQDTQNGKTVRHYPLALRPETVARRALRGSRLGMAVTTCGLPALVQRIASKFLPNCFIMACWEGLRRI